MTDRPFRASAVAAVAAALVGPLVALLLPAAPAAAGVTYPLATRQVEARNADGPAPADRARDDGTGPFAGEAVVDYRDATGRRMRARAAQSSVLGETAIRVTGDLSARSESGHVFSNGYLEIEVMVTEPTRFALGSSLSLTTAGPAGPADTSLAFDAGIYAGQALGRPGPVLANVRLTDQEFGPGPARPVLSAEGTLAAGGTYVLFLNASAFADATPTGGGTLEPAEINASYTLDLRFGDNPGPGPGPGPVVPLPPAGWAGLLTLGGIAVARWRAARRGTAR